MKTKLVNLCLRISLSIISLVLLLILSELALKSHHLKPEWVADLSSHNSFKDMDICGPYDFDTILMPKNSLCDKKYNNSSLRDIEQPTSIDPLIVFMGDSFVYGHGVNNSLTYPAQFQKMLNEQSIHGKVVNAGIPGSGTDIQLAYFEKYILTNIKPNIVIWNIHENDLGDGGDNNLFCLYSIKDNQLIKHNGMFNTKMMKYNSNKIMPNAILKLNTYWFIMNHIPDRWTIGCSKNIENDSQYFNNKLRLLLDQIIQLSHQYRFKLVFTFIEGQQAYEQTHHINKYYDDTVNKYIKIIRNSNIPIIHIAEKVKEILLDPNNLNSTLSAQIINNGISLQNSPDTLFFKKDGFEYGIRHMNEIGNKLVAEVVYRFLIKIKYL